MSDSKTLIDLLIKERLDLFVSVIADEVPGGDNPDTLDGWLTSIPGRGNIQRDRGRPRSDLQLIVNDLDKLLSGDGRWALELFIRPIIQEHQNFAIAGKLKLLLEFYLSLKKKQSELRANILIEQEERRLHLGPQVENNRRLTLEKLLEPYNFDLKILARECVNMILRKHDLIGFAIPYDSYPFLVNFCERIKIDLGRKNIHPVRAPLDLKPYVMRVDRAISRIMEYKSLLETGDVICPVLVPPSEGDITNHFWKSIRDKFEADLKNCFIIIMTGSPDHNFPEGVVRLKSPQLDIFDLHEWVRDIGGVLDLPDFVIDIWRDEMERQCRNEDVLEIEEAYHHISMAKDLLNEYPEYEDFISHLLKRSVNFY